MEYQNNISKISSSILKIKNETEMLGPIVIKIGDTIRYDGTEQYGETIKNLSKISGYLSSRNFLSSE